MRDLSISYHTLYFNYFREPDTFWTGIDYLGNADDFPNAHTFFLTEATSSTIYISKQANGNLKIKACF